MAEYQTIRSIDAEFYSFWARPWSVLANPLEQGLTVHRNLFFLPNNPLLMREACQLLLLLQLHQAAVNELSSLRIGTAFRYRCLEEGCGSFILPDPWIRFSLKKAWGSFRQVRAGNHASVGQNSLFPSIRFAVFFSSIFKRQKRSWNLAVSKHDLISLFAKSHAVFLTK
jgi:hypothetical protein